ncbi:hypothetical protein B5X24_HaOG200735 [Helicoverpa armigera]|uniref:Gustatory receptor n=1 Tax=Helicoverpa armigera TaxID=29058 RepID=A0A2W1BTV6_HELAM|nr:hypothetical protein B5X24_HaOG200735 [Helicoverpa armigera]
MKIIIINNYKKINFVDEDIRSMLLPLNLAMLCPKYSIKGNLIAPNTFRNNCVSIVITLVLISAMCYRTYGLSFYQDGFSNIVYYYSYYDVCYYSFGYIMNYIISVYQTEQNISLVLTLQKLHRLFNDAAAFKRFIIFNWIFVITALVTHLLLVTSACLDMLYHSKVNLIGYLLVLFDIYIIYCFRLMKFMEDKVHLWKSKLESSEEFDVCKFCEIMFESYVDILKCYDMIKDCFQRFVSMILFFNVSNIENSCWSA